jgi:hypothetical protein
MNDTEKDIETLAEFEPPVPLSVVESQERANIDMLVSTAKRYPRNPKVAIAKMIAMATADEETALSMHYRLKRRDKDGSEKIIEGESVRLAEVAHTCWGNMRSATRAMGHDGKTVTSQAFAHDLENNNFVAWEVQRRITNKNGRTYSEDMIVTTANAAAAIAWRNSVIKAIGKHVIAKVSQAAKVAAFGGVKTIEQRWQDAIARFAKISVAQDQLLNLLELEKPEDITMNDLETLYGVFTAIKEGTTTIEEQFPTSAPKDMSMSAEVLTLVTDAKEEDGWFRAKGGTRDLWTKEARIGKELLAVNNQTVVLKLKASAAKPSLCEVYSVALPQPKEAK